MTEDLDPVEVARRAFLDRPRFSLRFHILLSVVALGAVLGAGLGTVALLIDRAPATARTVAVVTLLGTPVLAVLMAWLLYRRTVHPIRRFLDDADRIAGGDHTPLVPVRPYRDEFTELALALNKMIVEIERRQDLGLKSEKLRAIGLLAAGVAHELNNPLQNILLTAHGLMEEHGTMPEEERWELLRDLVKEADRARGIVSNLLDFARQSSRESKPVAVEGVLEKAVWLARSHLRAREVTVHVKAAPYLPQVTGSRDQLVQVFLNLVMNAADVTDGGGVVRVTADRDDDPSFVAVRVTDRGPGIPEHVSPHIFEPFFSTKPRGRGTGIGLAISRAILRRHGGGISVEGTGGDGTTFLVRLPAVALPPEHRERKNPDACARARGELG